MDRRYRYTRRLERRAQLARSSAGLAIIGVAICATAFALSSNPDALGPGLQAAAPARALLSSFAPASKSTTRRVYPFSIVPGGVASQTELVRIVRSDRVVASHYATFDVSRAYPVTVAAPRAVHVSYRKGNKVYWTAKKVMLREGETLLSDGKSEMRTRCANRVSDVAQFPVEAQEPNAALLDTAFDEDLADAEEGRRINAAMDLAEDVALSGVAEQPQLSALPVATATQVASTTVGRTAGAAPGAWPPIAEQIGTRTVAQVGAAGTPGALPQADGVSTAPAMLMAMAVGQSSGVASDPTASASAPASTGSVAGADAAPVQPESESAPTRPGLAVTQTLGTAMPVAPTTAGEEKPKATELPEPGTAWLIALALGSMLLLRNKS
jgi:hypothetical protein